MGKDSSESRAVHFVDYSESIIESVHVFASLSVLTCFTCLDVFKGEMVVFLFEIRMKSGRES